jgi:hypothetical protein
LKMATMLQKKMASRFCKASKTSSNRRFKDELHELHEKTVLIRAIRVSLPIS